MPGNQYLYKMATLDSTVAILLALEIVISSVAPLKPAHPSTSSGRTDFSFLTVYLPFVVSLSNHERKISSTQVINMWDVP